MSSLRNLYGAFKGRRKWYKEALWICPQVVQLAPPEDGLVCLGPPTDRPERVPPAISRLRRVPVSECEGNHTRVQLIVITAVWRKGKRWKKKKKKKKKGQCGEEEPMTVRL